MFWFKSLRAFLLVIGCITLLAFAAAIMPGKWMVETTDFLGVGPFHESPITFYLARNLSLLYGFVGVLMLYLCRDIYRYRHLIRMLAGCTVGFGLFQLIVDTQAGLPVWWALSESFSTILGGSFFYFLQSRVDWSAQKPLQPDQPS